MLFLLFVPLFLAETVLISDIQYPVPSCNISGIILPNNFGRVAISNNLLGTTLQFDVTLDYKSQLCRLCDLNPLYCTTSYGNATDLYFCQDTSYNVRLLALNEANLSSPLLDYALPRYTTRLEVSATSLLPYHSHNYDGNLCGHEYRFVALVILTVAFPLHRDVLTILSQSPSQTVPCGGNNPDLSCRVTPQYYDIVYNATNCLVQASQSSDIVPVATHSSLYWHLYRARWPAWTPTLCGESWSSLLSRIAPQTYMCSAKNALYYKAMPWYEAALEVMTAYLNRQPAPLDSDILLGLDLLERYCAVRQSGVISLEQSVFNNITLRLRETHQPVTEEECHSIEETMPNLTLPFYANHYVDWEMTLFSYILYPDYTMPTRAILLLTLLIAFVAVPVLCCVVGLCVTRGYCHCRRGIQYGRIV